MTNEIKQYLQENKELIITSNWEEFFKHAPKGIGHYLYKAGIPFLNEMNRIPKYCFYKTDINSIKIPNNIKSIGEYAFESCSNLVSVTFSEGSQLTSIGSLAFYDCSSLTSITIPASVTSIGDSAFNGCSSLTSITIPEGVTNIDDSAFYGCDSLKSITISDGVIIIGYSAFKFCRNLTSITIPNSVTRIGNDAFENWGNIEITYGGTKEQWENIYNSKAFKNTSFIVHCTDGNFVKKKK